MPKNTGHGRWDSEAPFAHLKLVTLNLWKDNRGVQSDLAWAMGKQAQFVVLQECKNWHQEIQAAADYHKYHMVSFKGGPKAQNVILVQGGRMKLTDLETRLMHKSNAFPSSTRYMPSVVAYDEMLKRNVMVGDVHQVPHIDHRGHPIPLPRQLLVRKYGQGIAAQDKKWDGYGYGLRFFLGDWNVDQQDDRRVRSRHFPVAAMDRLGYDEVRLNAATNGRRTIDRCFYRESANIDYITGMVSPDRKSDHRGVVILARVRRRS